MHVNEAHPGKSQIHCILYRCKICKLAFGAYNDLTVHMSCVHQPKMYCQLEDCKVPVLDLVDLESHFKSKHTKRNGKTDYWVQCKECSKIFSSEKNALTHHSLVHKM